MNKSDVQKDWPVDPVNDELCQLAERLQGAAPPLPAEALARVQQQLHAELDAAQRWHRRRRLAFGWSIAAAMLLALSGYAYFRAGSDSADPAPLHAKKFDALEPVLIEDRITVALGESAAPVSDQPLVRLDENRSLFAD